METATNHFTGILDDDDIGEILRELKSEHAAQSMNYENNQGEYTSASFKDKIAVHIDTFIENLAEIDNEWNATKEHQQMALT